MWLLPRLLLIFPRLRNTARLSVFFNWNFFYNRKQRLTDFMEGFGIITSKLKEMYQMITLGKHLKQQIYKL
jgi:hypothetical protein